MAGIGTARAAEIGLGQGAGVRTHGFFSSVLRLARAKPLGAVSAVILIALVVVALLAPVIAPYSPISNNHSIEMQPPSAKHLFGTDQFGRDELSRIIWGARVSLEVGLGATIAGGVIAVVIGIVSAYFG